MIQGRAGIINSIWFLRRWKRGNEGGSRVERRAKRQADKVPGTVRPCLLLSF